MAFSCPPPISESVPPKAKPADAEPKPEKPKPAAPAPAVEPKPETDEERDARLKREEEERLKAEELQKAKEFYAKFPSPYWGPERSTMIFQKKARGQALSAAESEFDKDYAKLWKKGQEASAPKSEPKKD